jgi:putative ABC transport system ATP-binding protein
LNIIETKNLKKDYFLDKTIVHALRGIDLEVEKGEFISIVGPSGSGKTTLLNIIGCIDYPSEGMVKISNVDISSLSDKEITNLRLHKIGFIFQTFNLIPVLNALENVEFPLLLMKNKDKKKVRKKAQQLLESVGLKEYIKHKPAELSGGQRQRVAIARALVTEPEIVLADEPTANLDSVTGASVLDTMREMNNKLHTTFVFSTHDSNVLKYAQRIIKIKDGLIQKE